MSEPTPEHTRLANAEHAVPGLGPVVLAPTIPEGMTIAQYRPVRQLSRQRVAAWAAAAAVAGAGALARPRWRRLR